jgi:bacterioferritin-associated ferredoxin
MQLMREVMHHVADEPSMGTAARCARCGWLAFTMISEARVYCDVCDEVR